MTALKKGFTLVELIVVIAIIGVLAVVVLIAINPAQQLARTRDAGRKSGITQMGHALEAYAVSRDGIYPVENASWATSLVTAGELSTVPSKIAYATGVFGCANAEQATDTDWCYDYNTGGATGVAVAYTELESTSDKSKCPGAKAWFVWSTFDGRGGTVCKATEPVAGGAQTFAD